MNFCQCELIRDFMERAILEYKYTSKWNERNHPVTSCGINMAKYMWTVQKHYTKGTNVG